MRQQENSWLKCFRPMAFPSRRRRSRNWRPGLALQLEVNNPELASDVRQSLALMQEAKSDYVARVNSWFDQTIDRVGQRFTKYTHYVTLAIATLVVLAVQLDMIAVIDRLSVDDHFREKVVNSAIDNFQAQSPKDDKQNGAKDKNSVSTKNVIRAARNGAAAGTTPWTSRRRIPRALGQITTGLSLAHLPAFLIRSRQPALILRLRLPLQQAPLPHWQRRARQTRPNLPQRLHPVPHSLMPAQ